MPTQVPASGLRFRTTPEVIFTNWREALRRSGWPRSARKDHFFATVMKEGVILASEN